MGYCRSDELLVRPDAAVGHRDDLVAEAERGLAGGIDAVAARAVAIHRARAMDTAVARGARLAVVPVRAGRRAAAMDFHAAHGGSARITGLALEASRTRSRP